MGRPRLPEDEKVSNKRGYWRKYYYANRAACIERCKKWWKNHPEKRFPTNKKCREKLKSEMIIAYGSKCACCNDTNREFLTLDHIYRDGQEHAKRLGLPWNVRGYKIWKDLQKQSWPKDRYRLLCMNCNYATRFGDLCPHQKLENG